jgi:polyhydroxybutyrate depolymerase
MIPIRALVLVVVLAACGTATATDDAATTTTAAATTTTAARSAPPCALPGEADGPGVRVVAGRTVRIALPDDVDRPPPLVVSLHGHGGRADEHDAATGLGAKGAARGIAVVTPQGDGDPARWNFDRRPDGPDDHAFIGDLIDALVDGGCADPDRVTLAGSSNGAAFAGLLACTPPQRVAAVVMVIATVPTACAVDVLTIRGTADTKVPFAGTPELVAADAAARGCDPAPTTERHGAAETTRYDGCRDGRRVTLVAVDGSGHVWPGSERDPDPGFDATDAVLDLAAGTGAP